MNNIILILTAGFVANMLLIAGLAIMIIVKEKNNDETLKASHQVLYGKMMIIQDELKLLLKNLDIEEEATTTKDKTAKVAHITKINGEKAEVNNTVFVSPQNIEQLRGHDFSVIHIDEDYIHDIDLKLFYDILTPMRAKNNTIVDFCCYKDNKR